MQRKIIQIANSTQLVSLPRKWSKKYNLKKGEELNLTEEGNKIIVSTTKDIEGKKTEFDARNLNYHLVQWSVTFFYKAGYDEVLVRFNSPETIRIIQQALENTLGFEVIDQKEDMCRIKNLSRGLEQEFDSSLRRAFHVTLSMATDSLQRIKNKKYDNLKDIIVLENTNNKLINFCERILNTKGYEKQDKTTFIYLIAWVLESIGDDYRDMCKYISNSGYKKEMNKDIVKYYEQINIAFEQFFELFYEKIADEKKMVLINETKKIVEKNIDKHIKNMDPKDIRILFYLKSIITRIDELLASVLAIKY